MEFLTGFLDFFLPRICPGCKTKLEPDEKVVCHDCRLTLRKVDYLLLKSEFERKFLPDEFIQDFKSLFVFKRDLVFQNLIHELKYRQQFRMGLYLGKLLHSEFSDTLNSWNPHFIVPVPLHELKKAERGFNQSYFIAKGLSKMEGIPVSPKVIKRVKYTQSQTALGAEERKTNMDGVFEVTKPQWVKDKNIVILDDVITTGSTVNECAKALKDCGAGNIYALSVAMADR